MVDVGGIHKFSGSTTGDRFAGGLVGYALEMAIDDVWTKSSKQEEAVNDVKLKLIQKTLSIYPDVNMLFNFDVDFREMGVNRKCIHLYESYCCYWQKQFN